MRRVLLISLSLVLALVDWSTVCAEDGIYVIPSMKVVSKTGQTVTYGTRDDGALQKGVAWPTPRFTDNGNGTVTDNLTRLIWMKNANAFGARTWDQALGDANGLQTGQHDLSDGSKPGDWRLPNLRELQSLVDYGRYGPALPADSPFTWEGLQMESAHWSSTTGAYGSTSAWRVHFYDGFVDGGDKTSGMFVVCVRGGK
jgi:hypothetical protein